MVVYVLLGAVLALSATSVQMFVELRSLRHEVAWLENTFAAEAANFRESAAAVNAANRRHLDELEKELQEARGQSMWKAVSVTAHPNPAEGKRPSISRASAPQP